MSRHLSSRRIPLYLSVVLVQPEMDGGRSPLVSIAPFSAGQSATDQYSCG